MAELKTKPTDASVERFLKGVKDEQKRNDCWTIVEIMQKATKSKPIMWGPSIVGFGKYRYKGASGRAGDWMLTGFSPRKQNITLYIMAGFSEYDDLLTRLGKQSTGKSCLYIKRLEDVHVPTIRKLVQASVKRMQAIERAADR